MHQPDPTPEQIAKIYEMNAKGRYIVMKFQMPKMSSFGCTAAVCSVAVLTGLATSARADAWDKKTTLTINQPVQVTRTVLEPGQYVFKLLNSNSDRHVVQIFNADQTKIVDTVLAIPNYRLQPTGDSRFTMWETPPGYVKAMRAWFYPGDNFGQEFTYPKQLRQVAMATTTTTETVPFHEAEAAPEPAPAPAAEPAPAVEEPAPAPAPAPVAEEPAPAPAPAPEQAPAAELPHTATIYPMLGLFGILSVGLFALLRLRSSQ